MTLRRYNRTPIIVYGKKYGTNTAIPTIRNNIELGNIPVQTYITKENERLDIIAGKYYGNGALWWLIAAASGVGWGLQVPPGTILKIPDFNVVEKYIG